MDEKLKKRLMLVRRLCKDRRVRAAVHCDMIHGLLMRFAPEIADMTSPRRPREMIRVVNEELGTTLHEDQSFNDMTFELCRAIDRRDREKIMAGHYFARDATRMIH